MHATYSTDMLWREEAFVLEKLTRRYGTDSKLLQGIVGSERGIFAFLISWNEFALASQLTRSTNSKTLPVGLLDYTAEFTIDWRGMCALAVVMIIPALILTYAVRKHLVSGLTTGAIKG